MGASRYVGRIGGLAVALGVGAAAFSGNTVAWADRGDSGPDAGTSTNSDSPGLSAAHGHRGGTPTRSPGAAAAVAGGTATNRQQIRDSRPVRIPGASVHTPGPTPGQGSAASAVVGAEVPVVAAVPAPVAVQTSPAAAVEGDAPTPEPATAGEVTGVIAGVSTASFDGAGSDPLLPLESPASWALLAYARRQTLGAASIGNAPAALVGNSQKAATKGITVNPVVALTDGIFNGVLNATSSRGLDLKYAVVGGTASGSNGGKISLGTNVNAPTTEQGFTLLPYRTWDNLGVGKGMEDWQVRVSEVTGFDQFVMKIPLAGLLASPIISLLQQTPIVGPLLAPLIGASVLATITADVVGSAPGATPLAYTYKVSSFDGTLISANFFPAVGLSVGDTAATVLNGPGLAEAGQIDPYIQCGICGFTPEAAETLGVGALRQAGYNVVSWDPRGEFNSGGVLQLDNPFYEGRDVSALVSWIASDNPATLNGPGDPKVGMVGGSYGGGIQLVAAGTDPRIDAIVPDIAWNSLNQSLYPSATFKTAWGSLLLLSLVATGARINSQIYNGIFTGDVFGWLSQSSQAVLSSSGPTSLLTKLTAPTLLTQAIVDGLFPLDQSMINAQSIIGNGTPAKVIWFCGGHGVCADPVTAEQPGTLRQAALDWLSQYVAGTGTSATAIPNFQWFDQLGKRYASNTLPTEVGFNDLAPVTATSDGATLGIIPVLGGSGPGAGPVPFSFVGAAPARNAIDVPLTVPVGTQVVGAPTLSFTYKGLGNSRAVFAQIVDNSTNLVLGQIVTPVPVTLDGKQHQVSIDLNDIVYTYGGTKPGSLTLQITGSATALENSKIGFITVSDVAVTLPNRTVQP